MTWEVIQADILDWCAGYEGEKFHACLCDPPYELAFMNRKWDQSGIAFQPATWAAIAEHLHPGGFLMAFGGSRTYHRLACAVEDAGLIIHSAIVWINSQGFPKATRIDTQIDKAAGAKRVNGKLKTRPDGTQRPNAGNWTAGMGYHGNPANEKIDTLPATPLAATWAGHRYGLQALKPCAEFVLVAQKPYSGKPVDSIVATGAGALWIDGARVGTDTVKLNNYKSHGAEGCTTYGPNGTHAKEDYSSRHSQGRWPPNVILSHSEGCRRVGVKRVRGDGHFPAEIKTSSMFESGYRKQDERYLADPDGYERVADWECVDSCAVKALADQSGERPTGKLERKRQAVGWNGRKDWRDCDYGGDTGTAARFFPQASWQYEIAERPFDYVQDRLAGVTPFRYQAKSARRERDQGLDGVVRLRSDLSEEKKKWVLQELQRAGVSPLG